MQSIQEDETELTYDELLTSFLPPPPPPPPHHFADDNDDIDELSELHLLQRIELFDELDNAVVKLSERRRIKTCLDHRINVKVYDDRLRLLHLQNSEKHKNKNKSGSKHKHESIPTDSNEAREEKAVGNDFKSKKKAYKLKQQLQKIEEAQSKIEILTPTPPSEKSKLKNLENEARTTKAKANEVEAEVDKLLQDLINENNPLSSIGNYKTLTNLISNTPSITNELPRQNWDTTPCKTLSSKHRLRVATCKENVKKFDSGRLANPLYFPKDTEDDDLRTLEEKEGGWFKPAAANPGVKYDKDRRLKIESRKTMVKMLNAEKALDGLILKLDKNGNKDDGDDKDEDIEDADKENGLPREQSKNERLIDDGDDQDYLTSCKVNDKRQVMLDYQPKASAKHQSTPATTKASKASSSMKIMNVRDRQLKYKPNIGVALNTTPRYDKVKNIVESRFKSPPPLPALM